MFFRLYGDLSSSFIITAIGSIADYTSSDTVVKSMMFLKYNKEEGLHLLGFSTEGEGPLSVDTSEHTYTRDMTVLEFLDIIRTPLKLIEEAVDIEQHIPDLALELIHMRDMFYPTNNLLQ